MTREERKEARKHWGPVENEIAHYYDAMKAEKQKEEFEKEHGVPADKIIDPVSIT